MPPCVASSRFGQRPIGSRSSPLKSPLMPFGNLPALSPAARFAFQIPAPSSVQPVMGYPPDSLGWFAQAAGYDPNTMCLQAAPDFVITKGVPRQVSPHLKSTLSPGTRASLFTASMEASGAPSVRPSFVSLPAELDT